MDFIAPLIGFLGTMYLIGWVVSTIVEGRRRMQAVKARAELNNRILEKYGSGREFVEFMQSDAGRRFLDSVTAEPSSPTTRVLGSVQKGVIATLLGLGLILVSSLRLLGSDTSILTVFGILALSLGVGFLISAFLSYRLSRSLGLILTADETIRHRLVPQP
jgi:Ca2+/Na+ antiporter